MSPIPATPTIREEAIKGTTIIRSARRNKAPTGSVTLAITQARRGSAPPHTRLAMRPTATPAPRPIRIRLWSGRPRGESGVWSFRSVVRSRSKRSGSAGRCPASPTGRVVYHRPGVGLSVPPGPIGRAEECMEPQAMTRDDAFAAAARETTQARDLSHGGLAGHPKGLSTLFLTEMWERFSYYGMRAILLLFMVAPTSAGGLGFDTQKAAGIYGLYTGSVYLASIPGGWIADRLLGLRRAVMVGAILIAMGHYSLAVQIMPMLYAGLILIVLGVGLLKPNISSIVGQLYPPGDTRRDAGFSIFYMGINLGAFISPFICGYLGQRVGWHWGFGAAGVGMTLGLAQYVLGQRRLGDAGIPREPLVGTGVLWAKVAVTLAALTVLLYFVWPYRDYVVLLSAVGVFAWLLAKGGDTPAERKRIGAIILLFVFATLFWAGFEQAGSSLTLFADQITHNQVFGWEFPSSWYQSVEPMFVISLAPVFAWLWIR